MMTCTSGVFFPEVDWYNIGQEELTRLLSQQNSMKKARNIVLFLGDGMGMSTITAARIYKGQKQGRPGEEETLNFEGFPNVGLSKVRWIWEFAEPFQKREK